jgi:hypothetical protein
MSRWMILKARVIDKITEGKCSYGMRRGATKKSIFKGNGRSRGV